MAGQTACPEEALARARKHSLLEKQMVVWSEGGGAAKESKFEISNSRAMETGKRISKSYRRGYEHQG